MKFSAKEKSLNQGPKMPNLRILELKFENTIVIFQISVLEIVLLESLVPKKILKFETKNALFRYFWASIL